MAWMIARDQTTNGTGIGPRKNRAFRKIAGAAIAAQAKAAATDALVAAARSSGPGSASSSSSSSSAPAPAPGPAPGNRTFDKFIVHEKVAYLAGLVHDVVPADHDRTPPELVNLLMDDGGLTKALADRVIELARFTSFDDEEVSCRTS